MEAKEFKVMIDMIREAGASMTNEKISLIGAEAERLYGIDKDTLMLIMLSGREDFKQCIFEQAQKINTL